MKQKTWERKQEQAKHKNKLQLDVLKRALIDRPEPPDTAQEAMLRAYEYMEEAIETGTAPDRQNLALWLGYASWNSLQSSWSDEQPFPGDEKEEKEKRSKKEKEEKTEFLKDSQEQLKTKDCSYTDDSSCSSKEVKDINARTMPKSSSFTRARVLETVRGAIEAVIGRLAIEDSNAGAMFALKSCFGWRDHDKAELDALPTINLVIAPPNFSEAKKVGSDNGLPVLEMPVNYGDD